jgi:hypothetical protein
MSNNFTENNQEDNSNAGTDEDKYNDYNISMNVSYEESETCMCQLFNIK